MTSVLVNVRIGVMVPHISVFLLCGPTTGSGVMYCSGSVCLSVRLVCTCNSGMELESSNLIFEFSVTIIVTQDAVLRSRGQRSRSHGLAELDTRCVITDERLAERSSKLVNIPRTILYRKFVQFLCDPAILAATLCIAVYLSARPVCTDNSRLANLRYINFCEMTSVTSSAVFIVLPVAPQVSRSPDHLLKRRHETKHN